MAFDTEGPDAHQLALPEPPKFDSAREIAEIAENYWMALLRDVPFANYTRRAEPAGDAGGESSEDASGV